jgi:hypothetical protein
MQTGQNAADLMRLGSGVSSVLAPAGRFVPKAETLGLKSDREASLDTAAAAAATGCLLDDAVGCPETPFLFGAGFALGAGTAATAVMAAVGCLLDEAMGSPETPFVFGVGFTLVAAGRFVVAAEKTVMKPFAGSNCTLGAESLDLNGAPADKLEAFARAPFTAGCGALGGDGLRAAEGRGAGWARGEARYRG